METAYGRHFLAKIEREPFGFSSRMNRPLVLLSKNFFIYIWIAVREQSPSPISIFHSLSPNPL